jgi:cytochrome P450
MAKKVLGEGLLTSEGNLHRNQRQLIQPAFHQDRLTAYAAIMTECILRMSNRWRDNDTLDVHKEFTQLTLAVVCKALFNFDIESEAKEIGKHVTTVVEYFNRARMPLAELIGKLPLPSNRRFQYAKKQLDTIIYRMIDGTSIAKGNDLRQHDRDGDLISILLAHKNVNYDNGELRYLKFAVKGQYYDDFFGWTRDCSQCINMDILPSLPKQERRRETTR